MTSKALICYDNALERAQSVTASSVRGGFAAANASDWRTTTYWSPSGSGQQTLTAVFASPVSADYFACYRHNLATAGATIVLQRSTDGGANWLDCFAPAAPADNECVIRSFAGLAATHWRVKLQVSGTAELFLGLVAFGVALVPCRGMPAGFVIPRHGRKVEILNNRTEGGGFSGRSLIARGAETRLTIRHAKPAWVRANWEPFVRHAELKPFFFSWNHAAYPEDAVYCWRDGDPPPPALDDDGYQTLTLPVQCLLSGDY